MGFGHRNITIFVMVGVFGFLLGSFGIYSSNTDNSLPTESVMAIGHIELVVKDADGNIKQYQQTDNLIVDIGFNTMADLIFPGIDLNNNSTDSKFNVLAIGTSSSSESEQDLGLISPVGGCANATANVQGSGAFGPSFGAQVTLDALFEGVNGCTGTFQEAAIYNDLSDGEMLSRQTFTGITLATDDVLDIFWDIGLGGAVEVGP